MDMDWVEINKQNVSEAGLAFCLSSYFSGVEMDSSANIENKIYNLNDCF